MRVEFQKFYIALQLLQKMNRRIKTLFNTDAAVKLCGFFTHLSMSARISLFTNYPNQLNLEI